MDLNISADEAIISTNRSSGQVSVTLVGIDKRDLLSKEIFQAIGIADFVGEFGGKNTFDFLSENYPELFEN